MTRRKDDPPMWRYGDHVTRVCVICSDPFVWVAKRGRAPDICSNTCRLRRRMISEQPNATRRGTEIKGVCVMCGDQFTYVFRGKRRKVCSTGCYPCKTTEAVREVKLRNGYGLTIDQFESMIKSQGGKCAICSDPFDLDQPYAYAVDHDHLCCAGDRSCGECVRGILCKLCNWSLGSLRDNPKSAIRAAQYLRKHRGQKPLTILGPPIFTCAFPFRVDPEWDQLRAQLRQVISSGK
jgi:hypothetical protein